MSQFCQTYRATQNFLLLILTILLFLINVWRAKQILSLNLYFSTVVLSPIAVFTVICIIHTVWIISESSSHTWYHYYVNIFLIFIIHSYLIYTSIDIDGAASLIRKGNKSLKYRNQCHLAVKNRKIGQRASYTRGIDGELGILSIYILSSDISTFGRDFVSNVLRCFQDDDCRGWQKPPFSQRL